MSAPQLHRLTDGACAHARAQAVQAVQAGPSRLAGRHIALLGADDRRPLTAFERVLHGLGARSSRLSSVAWLQGAREHGAASARMLGRFYHLVDCGDLGEEWLALIEQSAGIPVLNGLAQDEHPLYLLADLMALREVTQRSFGEFSVRVVGDSRSALHRAALMITRTLGMNPAKTSAGQAAPDCALDTDSAASAGRARLRAPPAEGAADCQAAIHDAAARYRQALTAFVLTGVVA